MNAYESRCMQEATGETLRPGGFTLTDKAVKFCALNEQNRVLDLGCGMGATASYLYENYGIKIVGIDPSQKLLGIAKAKNAFATFVAGSGDSLPFMNESFDCVLAECTLSLMNDLPKSLQEVFRVLKHKGWFVITDVHAKNAEAINQLDNFSINSCMRGLHHLPSLQMELEKIGFEVMLLEDCSQLLKELMVKIIFSHGSMGAFWSKTIDDETPQACCAFEQNLKECKPGYFMMIVKKGENNG
ncbi:MAG: methyltransferase domain-containing protein [Sulfurospirillaceae bacterium]|nr:methyltransferase domain-containing protein [Sulfurospirillaceae bacterium]